MIRVRTVFATLLTAGAFLTPPAPAPAEPRAKVAWEALQQAQEHQAQASPVERALITALARRYQGPQPLDPARAGPVLTAYAEAMKGVARQFPEDLDAQVLFAEAMMNV